jgi:hypothetical protein
VKAKSVPTVFLLGKDYHLGDLLWLIPVLSEYRAQRRPSRLIVGLPDRDVSRILESAPPVDRVMYGTPDHILGALRVEFGNDIVAEDLRMVPVGIRIIRQWRRRLPWLYYWDLWVKARGQWLATLLDLGPMKEFRPELRLHGADRIIGSPAAPYVLLAPHIGSYSFPVLGHLWKALKGWPTLSWHKLARCLQAQGYTVVTLGARGQSTVPGTESMMGLPIGQVAALVEGAATLITGESGLWFVAAAFATPFVIVPWWLPTFVDWPAPMNVPYRLVRRADASPARVLQHVQELVHDGL